MRRSPNFTSKEQHERDVNRVIKFVLRRRRRHFDVLLPACRALLAGDDTCDTALWLLIDGIADGAYPASAMHACERLLEARHRAA